MTKEEKYVLRNQRFSLGDRVYWESCAAGTKKRKEGVIVGVVPAGKHRRKYLPPSWDHDTRIVKPDICRNRESYFVSVDQAPGIKPVVYHPFTSHLRKLEIW